MLEREAQSPPAWPSPTWSLANEPLTLALFMQTIAERGLSRIRYSSWSTDTAALPIVPDVVLYMQSGDDADAIVITDAYVARLRLDDGHIAVHLAAETEETLAEAHRALQSLFPRSQPTDGLVPVTFWTYSPHGPRAITRKIAVAPWHEIAGNYAAETAAGLDVMMNGFRPSHGGQLVLWQGPPGTGKTHALRALAWEWRDWAELHYVIDPDELFGGHADYLIDVLLGQGGELVTAGGDAPAERAWRVLVLEDTGELLAADAKERTGQALSRLLNTVDGMIGQGLRILVLVTTNEELKRLHPAVARPGRCALQLTFDELGPPEVEVWLAERGVRTAATSGTFSLAELYALADGYARQPQERTVGFAR